MTQPDINSNTNTPNAINSTAPNINMTNSTWMIVTRFEPQNENWWQPPVYIIIGFVPLNSVYFYLLLQVLVFEL